MTWRNKLTILPSKYRTLAAKVHQGKEKQGPQVVCEGCPYAQGILGGHRDFGRSQGFWEVTGDFGRSQGFWEVTGVLGCHRGFGRSQGFWEVTGILGCPNYLRLLKGQSGIAQILCGCRW